MKRRTRKKKQIRAVMIISFVVIIGLVLAGIVMKEKNKNLGIIGGADGPTSIYIGTNKDKDTKVEESDKASKEKREALIAEAQKRGLLILVNKQNPVEANYKPEDLVSIKYYASDRSEASRYMRKEAADHFHTLVETAKTKGFEIVMTTAYRSYDFQKQLYDNYVATEGQEAADTFSAKPGRSEHQTGLSTDVSSPSVNYSISNEYGDTEEGKWLAENAHQFGFIIRFPKGKEDITGYQYEPWHIRYVGETVAEEIYKKDITLEEFLEEEQ